MPSSEIAAAPARILGGAAQRRTLRLRANPINRIRRAVAAALLVGIAAAMATPGHAAAHSQLVVSTPPANSSLLTSPPSLSMTFSEAIDPTSASVLLLDERRAQVADLGAVGVDSRGLVVTVDVPPLASGVYTVSYRITSAVDGHVSTGTWAFLVDPTGTLPAPTLATQSSSPSSNAFTVAARWLALAAGLLLLGLALFWIVSARPSLAESTAHAAPWGVIALAAAVAFGGLAVYLTLAARPFVDASAGHVGHGGGGAFPLDFAAPFGATPFALAMRVAEVGAGVAFVLATSRYFALDEARRSGVTAPRDRDPLFLWLVAASAAASLAGSSLAGHAAARGGLLFAAVDWLHLVAVAAWVGTLPGLLLLAGRAPTLGAGESPTLGETLRRHSRLAFAAAPIVALTGIANSPLVLGDARGLIGSDYGNLLLAKVTLFGVAVAIGSVNFFLTRSAAFRRVLPLIAAELAIGALAVLSASSLVTGQPAAGRIPVPPPDTGIGVPLPLAWLWVSLPTGTAGWMVPIAFLLGLAVISAIERRGTGASRGLWPGLRLMLVLLAVSSGVGMGSRAAVELANQAPAGAAAIVNPIPATSDSMAHGHELYLANCAVCHGVGGAGDGVVAARMLPGPGDLAESVPRRTDGELAYRIATGTVATRMPAFAVTMSESDRWDLVNYLRSAWPSTSPGARVVP